MDKGFSRFFVLLNTVTCCKVICLFMPLFTPFSPMFSYHFSYHLCLSKKREKLCPHTHFFPLNKQQKPAAFATGFLFFMEFYSPAFLPLRNSHKGPAKKVEVYAPLEKPTSIAKEKLRIVSPPKRKMETTANKEVPTV